MPRFSCIKDKKHQRFIGPVMVRENWLYDANGKKLSIVARLEETPVLTPRGIVTCAECGGEAIIA